MIRAAILSASLLSTPLFGYEPFVPDFVSDLTAPVPKPPKVESLKRIPWTLEGAQFMILAAREMCQGADAVTYCEVVDKTNSDRGFRVIDKRTNKHLFYMDRAIAEEVQQDHALGKNAAEQHHPYSMYIARLESEKSDWDYVGVACTTGFGTYCGAMAAKLQKFKVTVLTGCGLANGVCQKFVADEKAKRDKEIKRVLEECAKGDQECFDAITGGQETAARAQSQLEKSSGARPPHSPTRPGFRPTPLAAEGVYVWGTVDCEHCKIIEGEEAEDY